MEKLVCSPRTSLHATCTSLTSANIGPFLRRSSKVSSFSRSPSAHTDTVPSGRFFTNPHKESTEAFRSTKSLYITPCTLPETTTSMRSIYRTYHALKSARGALSSQDRALSSVGRAPRLHRDGQRFESSSAHYLVSLESELLLVRVPPPGIEPRSTA